MTRHGAFIPAHSERGQSTVSERHGANGHIASWVRKQRQVNNVAWPTFSFFSSPGHQAMGWCRRLSHHNSETSSQACPKIIRLGSSCFIQVGNSRESGPFSGWTLSHSWSWVNSFHLLLYFPRFWKSCLFGSIHWFYYYNRTYNKGCELHQT